MKNKLVSVFLFIVSGYSIITFNYKAPFTLASAIELCLVIFFIGRGIFLLQSKKDKKLTPAMIAFNISLLVCFGVFLYLWNSNQKEKMKEMYRIEMEQSKK